MSSAAGMNPAVASADVLRLIAHELRQPLSTIESIAYYLTLVVPRDDPKIHEHVTRLQQLVEQSNWILASGLQLADLPRVSPEQIDLEELITQTIAARPSSIDPPLHLDLAGDLPLVLLDPGLARALIENLLTLFRQLATDAHPVTVRTSAGSPRGVSLDITTSASGFRSEAALGPGASLSVDSARRIVGAHGGSLELNVDAESGIRLRVMLP